MKRHQSAQKSSDKGNKIVEDGDGTGDDIGNQGNPQSTTDPGGPVDYRVGSQMSGALKQTDEGELGRELQMISTQSILLGFGQTDMNGQHCGDDQPGQTKPIADLLHSWTGRSQRGRCNV